MMYLGDIREDSTIHFKWSTRDASGASITRATDGTVSVYKADDVTQSAAGVTDTEDFDSLTGIHQCTVDTSADAFYTRASDYQVILSGATIDGQSVNDVLAHFSIENRPTDQAPNVGASINTTATSDSTITTGNAVSGTYASTAALDGVNWQIEDTGNTLDMYFEFVIPADGVPTSVTHTGRVMGKNDDLDVYAYNWDGETWEQIGERLGQSTSADSVLTYNLFTGHVGTGDNLGKVRVRFYGTGLSSADLYTDQVFLSYAVVTRSVGYANGAVWIDTNNGTAGTTSFINGTADNPVDTLADARTIAINVGLTHFHVASASSLTLANTYDDYHFTGHHWDLALGGQSIAGAIFIGAEVNGIGTGTDYEFDRCYMETVSLDRGDLHACSMSGTFTITGVGTYFLDQCFSGVAGANTPVVDFGAAVGSTNFNLRHYSGGVEIRNMGQSGTDLMSLEGDGQIVLASSCTGGVIAIRGNFTVTDNASGAVTLSDDARFTRSETADDTDTQLTGTHGASSWQTATPPAASAIADAVWDEAESGHTAANTFGAMVSALIKIKTNRWKIDATNNQLIIYDDDKTTALYTFDLTNESGTPTSIRIFERVPV